MDPELRDEVTNDDIQPAESAWLAARDSEIPSTRIRR